MSLSRLEIQSLRNVETLALDAAPRLNFIVGANASGKTTVLEAIHLLSRARSFRTAQLGQLIRFGAPALTAAGLIRDPSGTTYPLGIRIGRGEREIHLRGRAAQSSAELLRAFPVQIIQPASIALLEGPPRQRRQFLDLGVFHQEPAYLEHWRRFSQALSQRNVLLRDRRFDEIPPWTLEAARYGTMVTEARQRYVERLLPRFREVSGRFFPGLGFELRLLAGWDQNRPLAVALAEGLQTDARHGHTQAGPHKGDFSVTLDGRPVRAYFSRGQLKLLVYALLLAQARLIEATTGSLGCVLIDDVASELDPHNRDVLLDFLGESRSQCFITATGREMIERGLSEDAALWRMDAGRLIQA